MMLRSELRRRLLEARGVAVREACDRCGQLLGAIRFTRKDDVGVWCSPQCRGDAEPQAIRRGGRPRKHKNNADKQQAYRQRLERYETPLQLTENTKFAEAKIASLAYPLSPRSLELP